MLASQDYQCACCDEVAQALWASAAGEQNCSVCGWTVKFGSPVDAQSGSLAITQSDD